MVDYHMVMDLLPTLARLYFTRRIAVTLNELKSVGPYVCFNRTILCLVLQDCYVALVNNAMSALLLGLC